MSVHPSHKTRFSMDSSVFDEICVNCGATDSAFLSNDPLAEPCPYPNGDGPTDWSIPRRQKMPKVTDEEAVEIRSHIEKVFDGPPMNPSVESANDRQVGGTHYQSTIQHWDYVVANDIPYLEAQVIKYLTRWRKKNGIEDVYKAQHYLQKLIEVEEAKIKATEEKEASSGS